VHVDVGAVPLSVEVGTSVNESVAVGTKPKLDDELVLEAVGVAVTVALNGAAVTEKLTARSWEPPACSIAVRAVARFVHSTTTVAFEVEVEVESTGKARQVVPPVQGVISQLPSPEQEAVLLLMHATWPGVQTSSKRSDLKNSLEPCASCALVKSRRARAAAGEAGVFREKKPERTGSAFTLRTEDVAATRRVSVDGIIVDVRKIPD
jgi:hypothetical protein